MKLLALLLLYVNVFAYNIVVDVKACKMRLYDKGEVIKEYKVATIKEGLPIPGDGHISKVDLNPTWYPTQRTKDYFKEHKGIVLPSAVPAGHPQNYMGAFKITMTNSTASRGSVYRIHGNIDESKIGTRASGGCVRMYNDEGKEFAKLIDELLKKGERIDVHYMS